MIGTPLRIKIHSAIRKLQGAALPTLVARLGLRSTQGAESPYPSSNRCTTAETQHTLPPAIAGIKPPCMGGHRPRRVIYCPLALEVRVCHHITSMGHSSIINHLYLRYMPRQYPTRQFQQHGTYLPCPKESRQEARTMNTSDHPISPFMRYGIRVNQVARRGPRMGSAFTVLCDQICTACLRGKLFAGCLVQSQLLRVTVRTSSKRRRRRLVADINLLNH